MKQNRTDQNLNELEQRIHKAFSGIEDTLSYKHLLLDCYIRGFNISTLPEVDQRKIIFSYFFTEVPVTDRGDVFFDGIMQQSIDKVAACYGLGEVSEKDAADWLYLRIKEHSIPYIESDFEKLEIDHAS
jgi:hypothetical protein